ncbi:MAG: AI-2E family transporter [Candidatus Melainabacteria bacterium]|nr:MAG: AI-2E family transporter [Candidatus Melainabacteria bacterium]
MIKWFFLLLFLIFVYHVREVFPPFIVGGIVAYLLNPLVAWLCRKVGWMKPPIAVGVIYFGALFTVIALLVIFGPQLASEFKDIFDQREEMIGSVLNQISTQTPLNFNVPKVTADVMASLENAGRPAEIMHFGGVVSKSLLAILVCLVSSIYLIIDGARVGKFFLRFVPHERRSAVVDLSSRMNLMLSKYVSGQLILIVIMSGVSYFILTCFGIKYALFIGIFCGVMEIIPVLGPLLGIGFATIVGCTQLHFDIIALGIPAALFLARQIEDYIVVPKVIGHAVELHPLAVIFAVLVGEHMAGALGMLIAIPVAASVKLILDSSYPLAPDDQVEPKQHGGALAWLVAKYKGNPLDRKPEPPSSDEIQQEAAADWAHTRNEVTNEKLAEQMIGMQDAEAHEIKEAALIKLEERKQKAAEEKARKAALSEENKMQS